MATDTQVLGVPPDASGFPSYRPDYYDTMATLDRLSDLFGT